MDFNLTGLSDFLKTGSAAAKDVLGTIYEAKLAERQFDVQPVTPSVQYLQPQPGIQVPQPVSAGNSGLIFAGVAVLALAVGGLLFSRRA